MSVAFCISMVLNGSFLSNYLVFISVQNEIVAWKGVHSSTYWNFFRVMARLISVSLVQHERRKNCYNMFLNCFQRDGSFLVQCRFLDLILSVCTSTSILILKSFRSMCFFTDGYSKVISRYYDNDDDSRSARR